MKYEYRFFRKGTKEQCRPDIIVEIKRPDIPILDNWTSEQKEQLREAAMKDLKPMFDEFINTLTRYIETPAKDGMKERG